MTTRVLLLSDTHVPQRAKQVPDQVWRAVDDVDLVIHAGDWNDVPILDALEQRAARLIGVYGNNDGEALQVRLPFVAHETVDGVRVSVVHQTGVPTGREARMQAEFPNSDLLVFGHSHIPWDTTSEGGLRLLNPGSPTDRRRQPHCTYLTLTLDAGVIRDVELVPIPR